MIAPRVSSSAAWSETARLIGRPSAASASIFGTTPQVETVMRRGLMPKRSGSISVLADSVVAPQQRLARLAIGARLLAHELDGAPAERGRERLAQRLGEIGELHRRPFGPVRRVTADLPRAIGWLAPLAQPRDERLVAQIADGRPRVLHGTSVPTEGPVTETTPSRYASVGAEGHAAE